MLYSQQIIIPSAGEVRIGTIGGEPYEEKTLSDGRKQDLQVGFMLPVRYGMIKVDVIGDDNTAIFDCRADVQGYFGREITDCKCPAEIITEIPASIIIRGPEGATIIVEAWKLEALQSRGAARSFLPAAGIAIPKWATAFDVPSPGVATFRDNLANIVGVVTGPVVSFSIPSGASTVDFADGGANITPLVFRQQG